MVEEINLSRAIIFLIYRIKFWLIIRHLSISIHLISEKDSIRVKDHHDGPQNITANFSSYT